MKYALLIHGPFSTQWLSQINKQIKKFKKGFDKIVVVSYKDDYEKYLELLKSLDMKNIDIITVKDTINPGFFNINRQLLCVKAGLDVIDCDSYVFKLRNDQSVDFDRVAKYTNDEKIITTNCYSRKDRLYHPSDMFLFAKANLLKELYSLSKTQETHLMTEFKNKKAYKENPKLKALPYAPESILCRHYLKLKNWDFKETKEDSYEAIKKYYIVLNSWNIDFRWHKKRTHLCPDDYIILPHYFTVAPFEGVPAEKASCYLEMDFSNKIPSIKDLYYTMLSKFVWFTWDANISGIRKSAKKIKNLSRLIRYKVLKLLPYFIVKKEVERLYWKVKYDI